MQIKIFVLLAIVWMTPAFADVPLIQRDGDFSMASKEHSRWQVLQQLAALQKKKIVVAAEIREKLDAEKVDICMQDRGFHEWSEFLLGSQGYEYSSREGRIVVRPDQVNPTRNYEKLLVLYPDHPQVEQVYFVMGTWWVARKKYRLALAEYYHLYQQFPQSELLPQVLLLMGKCLIYTEDYERARKVLAQFFERFAGHDLVEEAFSLLAECHRREGDWRNSQKIYHYLLEQPGTQDKDRIKIELAGLYYQQKEYSKTSSLLDEVLAKENSPHRARALYEKAVCLYDSQDEGQFLLAAGQFYEELPDHPQQPAIRLRHARIVSHNGEYMPVFFLLKPLFANTDVAIRLEAYTLAAQALGKLGLWQRVVEMLQEAITAIPTGDLQAVRLVRELSMAYEKLGMWQKAKNTLGQLEPLAPQDFYLALLECNFRAGDYQACVDHFGKYRQQMSRDTLSAAFVILGNSLWQMGLEKEAEIAFGGRWPEETQR